MTSPIDRRVGKLEQAIKPDLPLHLPVTEWTRDQLWRAILPNGGKLSRAELEAVATGIEVDAVLAARRAEDAGFASTHGERQQ